jgi:polar amino acid transport system substrate-binding protein
LRRRLKGGLVTVVAGASLIAGAAHARTVEMCSVPWAPFYGPDLQEQGFLTTLARAAFDQAGHEAKMEFMPWARAMLEVKQGDRALVMGAYYSDERAETYRFSDVLYKTKVGLIALESLGVQSYDDLRELSDYTIGYGRGWSTTKEFDNADYLNKEAAKNNVLNVRKLYKERIDMIAMNFDRFNQIVREEGLDPDRAVFLNPPLKTSGLYLMFSEAIDDTDQLVSDFNSGLAQLRESGRYQAILSRYGLSTD